MMNDLMDHPGETQLQRYLDGELDEERLRELCAHLAACPECRALVDANARIGALVRASVPDPEALTSEGEFWLRISRRIEGARPAPRWEVVSFLPPVVLAALGSALQATLAIVVGLYALISFGVLPSLGGLVSERLPDLLARSWLIDIVSTRARWSSAEIAEGVTARWQALGALGQDAIVLSVGAAGVFTALAVIVVLYATWAWCWPGAARRQTEGGD